MKNYNVIIIGAPRSGTNMLRDILVNFDGLSTWPCDEINYIWRHGNIWYPSDEIPLKLANKKVKNYVKSKFEEIRSKYNAEIVIEKTCANSLRIPFVDSVIPDAKYIFICRDGIDATGSAKLRWRAKLEFNYIFQKLKYVPLSDIPFYGIRYLWSRIYRIFSKDSRLSIWGPSLNGMSEMFKNYSLNEVCALQWQRCVDSSEEALSKLPDENVFRVRYEDFVSEPAIFIDKILRFLNKDVSIELVQAAVTNVSADNVGKGRKALGDDEVLKLESLIETTLKRYEYL